MCYNAFMIKVNIAYGNPKKEITTLIDNEDWITIKKLHWYVVGKGYLACRKNKETIYLHRMITKCPKGMSVDHIDNNKLNNQKSNLRICDNSQNNAKKENEKTKIGKIRGVLYYKNSFGFNLQCKNVKIMGRGFENEDEAKKQYQELHKKYFGEFSPY